MLTLALDLAAAWILADLLSGVVHWAEDRYLSTRGRVLILRQIARDNARHHDEPLAMTFLSPWENVRESVAIAAVGAGGIFLAGGPRVLIAGLLFASLGNLVHRFAHLPRTRVPATVRKLQRVGLLASPYAHAKHHWKGARLVRNFESTGAYCAMTDWLNPFLDGIRFWAGLELVLSCLGINPTTESDHA